MVVYLFIIHCCYLVFGDSFTTPTYGGGGGDDAEALGQGRVNYLGHWGLIEDDSNWPFLTGTLTNIDWMSDNRTYYEIETIGEYSGNGQIVECEAMMLSDHEWIDTYRVLYSDERPGNGNYVFGLFFRSNKGNLFGCVTEDETAYDKDTGFIKHGGYFLSGFDFHAKECIDNIGFQFTRVPSSWIEESSSLSGGSIFLILVFSLLGGYCVIGFIITGLRNKHGGGFKDVSANIPNRDFWGILPAYVYMGCCYSKQYVMGKFKNQSSAPIIAHHDNL
eukprot:514152_1